MKAATILFLFSLVIFSGCETLITEIPQSELPVTTSKLVVNSFISPQSVRTIVVVTESIPIYGESSTADKVITDAIVKISDGVLEAIIPYDSAGKVYSILQTQFPIKASQKYTLTVSDSKKRSVSAMCTVPANSVAIPSYEIDTAFIREYDGRDTLITLKTSWQDIANKKNFYRVRGFMEIEYSVPEDGAQEIPNERRVRNRFNFDWDDNTGRSEFSNDVNIEGTVFTSPLGKSYLPTSILYYSDAGPVYARQKRRLVALTLEVLNTDQAYYDYHKSLALSRNSDNPFSEPALIFTNITGGLGCFAAYNSRQIVYKP